MLGRQPALVRSSLATQCCYVMLFILSLLTSLNEYFIYLVSAFLLCSLKYPFLSKFLQPNYFSPATCINLSTSLVTSFNLSLEPFSSCLSSLPSLSQVHCSGHASSLPTWHRTELLSARGPHDHGCLGAGLCRVLPSPLWLQHHR